MKYLLNPYNFIILSFFLSLISFLSYIRISNNLIFFSIPLLLLYIIFYKVGLTYSSRLINKFFRKDVRINSIYFRIIGIIIFLITLLEYYHFGFPLIDGKTLYSEYGYPLLHHLTVSSWIFTFIKYKNKYINYFFLIFSILNPLLISNRDLLLITIFSIAVKKMIEGKISLKMLLIFSTSIIFAFGALGQLRSGWALAVIDLPFSFNKDLLNPTLLWFVIYVTSSSFNMGYNMDDSTFYLYDSLINVFPEPYQWFVLGSLFGYYLYFILVFIIMTIASKQSMKKEYIPFLVYFLYQSIMGVTFATKVFTTNSLVVTFIFIIFYFINQLNFRLSTSNNS